jgi:hypothetical protein
MLGDRSVNGTLRAISLRSGGPSCDGVMKHLPGKKRVAPGVQDNNGRPDTVYVCVVLSQRRWDDVVVARSFVRSFEK